MICGSRILRLKSRVGARLSVEVGGTRSAGPAKVKTHCRPQNRYQKHQATATNVENNRSTMRKLYDEDQSNRNDRDDDLLRVTAKSEIGERAPAWLCVLCTCATCALLCAQARSKIKPPKLPKPWIPSLHVQFFADPNVSFAYSGGSQHSRRANRRSTSPSFLRSQLSHRT